jgi:glycosyltransferase involved in cell wall biosynthesis
MLGKTGIGAYVAQAIPRLPKYLPGAEFTAFGGRIPGFRTVPVGAGIYSLAEQVVLPFKAAGRGLDIFFSPHYNAPLAMPAPLAVMVFDLIHLLFPGQLPRPRWLSLAYARIQITLACARARVVLTDSENTRRDLVRMLGVPARKIRVVPLAVEDSMRPVRNRARLAAFRRAHGLTGPYVLFVSNLKPHKNPEGAIRALAAMRAKDVRLVIVGRGTIGYEAGLRSLAARVGVGDRVRFAGKITREELRWHYAGAAALAFPSFYEGFGLPPLEAFACGTPVVASTAASVPEVVGNAALNVRPGDIRGLARALDAVIARPALRRRLVGAGFRRVRRFSWDRAAELTAEALADAAGGRG